MRTGIHFAVALAGVLLVFSPVLGNGANLIYNGDFEIPTPVSPPAGWVAWGGGADPSYLVRDTNNPHGGEACFGIYHPAGVLNYTVTDPAMPITSQQGKAYEVTFWARTDSPGYSVCYWEGYMSIGPYVDAISPGRFPFYATTQWGQYSFTIHEGRDFFVDQCPLLLLAFRPTMDGSQTKTLWVDDVVCTEAVSAETPVVDARTLVYGPINHRLAQGTDFQVNIDANQRLGPVRRQLAGNAFHRMSGWGRHPYDPYGTYQFVGSLAPLETALQDLNLPSTRFYAVGFEIWGLTGNMDTLAGLCGTFQIPQEYTVITLGMPGGSDELTPQQVGTVVQHCVDEGYEFKYWETGSEVYTRRGNYFPTADDYIDYVKQVSATIKGIDPDAQIGIDVNPSVPGWCAYTLRETAGYYDWSSAHWYCRVNPYTAPFSTVVLGENYKMFDSIMQLNALMEYYNPGGEAYQFDTEWGVYGADPNNSGASGMWRSSNIVGALHRVVRLIYYVRESLLGGATDWEMFCRTHTPTFGHLTRDVPDKKMMLYWVFYFFNRYLGDWVLDLDGTCAYYAPYGRPKEHGPATPMLATISADRKYLYLIVANATWNYDYPAQVSLSNFSPKAAAGIWVSQSDKDADPVVYTEADAIGVLPVTVGSNTLSFTMSAHTIAYIRAEQTVPVGRYIFYNNCYFDGDDPGANANDDGAIAPDKTALLGGETATFANYTSYSRGINGIMIDIPAVPGTPTAADFEFKVGDDCQPAGWSAAPAPSSITVRSGAGVDGSDRITIIWGDNAVAKQWLQVTVKATANTALGSDDVFYFGNAIGETGNSPTDATVTPTDVVAVRNNPHTLQQNPAPIDAPWDFNRDRKVGPTDATIARNNGTNSYMTGLRLVSVPQ